MEDIVDLAQLLSARSEQCKVNASTEQGGSRSKVPAGEDRYRVVERLKRKFGLGDRPQLRLTLYRKLAALADQDEKVLWAISEAVAQSVGKRSPAKYFTVAVTRMLKDLSHRSQGAQW